MPAVVMSNCVKPIAKELESTDGLLALGDTEN
jgi:hypothetical protein